MTAEKKKQSYWKHELNVDAYWTFQHLSSTAFTLAGFSLAALSFFIGFYKQDLSAASNIISVLFLCTAFYMLSGEMAREAIQTVKFLLAETIYMLTSALLVVSFLLFIVQQAVALSPVVYVALVLTVGYLGWRWIHNIKVTIRDALAFWKAPEEAPVKATQIITTESELETYLSKGSRYVGTLPSGKIVVE